MPFTLVHPVITVPLRKYGLPFSALIIGSMAPDLNYFLLTNHSVGHTLAGQFYFCLPAGITAFWIFHLILKKPLIYLMPLRHEEKLIQIKSPALSDPKIYPGVIAGIIIGSFTHIIWDSFTHSYGFAVTHVQFLQAELISTQWGVVKLYKVLQHASTLIGGAIIVILYYRWYKATEGPSNYRPVISSYMKAVIIVIIAVTCFSLSLINGLRTDVIISGFDSIRNFAGVTIKTFLQVFLILILSYSIVWRIFFRETIR